MDKETILIPNALEAEFDSALLQGSKRSHKRVAERHHRATYLHPTEHEEESVNALHMRLRKIRRPNLLALDLYSDCSKHNGRKEK